MNLDQFVKDNQITARAYPAKINPNAVGFGAGAKHWTVVLKLGGWTGEKKISVPFTQGSMLHDPPTAVDVLECLVSDSQTWENTTTHYEMCEEYGMTPSEDTERTYIVMGEQARNLKQFLGNDRYRELLWEVEPA